MSGTRYRGKGNHDPSGPPLVPSIPLVEENTGDLIRDQSIGALVKDATSHLSTLIRSEVELARLEIGAEVRRGVKGSVLFIIALTILLFSSFFFFFALAELLADLGLHRSASYGIVFGLMLLTAGFTAFLGWLKVRRLRAPERTIDSVRQTAALFAPGPPGGSEPRP